MLKTLALAMMLALTASTVEVSAAQEKPATERKHKKGKHKNRKNKGNKHNFKGNRGGKKAKAQAAS